MTTWSVGRRRLLKLAAHLEKGNLGHKKFDFSVINTNCYEDGLYDSPGPSKCGTHGCGLGECPVVFPRQWRFLGTEAVLRNEPLVGASNRTFCSAQIFFAVNAGESLALFSPESFRPWAPNVYLGDSTTRKQEARNIRQFVKWKDKELSA